MRDLFPTMIDRPETRNILTSLFYGILAFWSLPFILLLFMQGSFQNRVTLAWCDIAYHIINFIMAFLIFKSYLTESFLILQSDYKNILSVALTAAGMMCAVILVYIIGFLASGSYLFSLGAFGALPLAEVELFIFSSDIIGQVPLFGTACMAVLTPLTISCLFYATAFAPACCRKSWLGYLLVALLLAFPRICNGITYWDPQEQFFMYLIQLPLHLIACWSYQKADTIWAPVVSLSITNLAASLITLILF